MVANLSSHKAGWDDRWEEFSSWAEKGMTLQKELLKLVDEDTRAFNRIMDAFGLSKNTEDEKKKRSAAIQEATRHAIEIPFKVMESGLAAMEIVKAMAETGNPNSVSDAGVGALAIRSGVLGAWLNVKINASGLKDASFKSEIIQKGEEMVEKVRRIENEVYEIVLRKISD